MSAYSPSSPHCVRRVAARLHRAAALAGLSVALVSCHDKRDSPGTRGTPSVAPPLPSEDAPSPDQAAFFERVAKYRLTPDRIGDAAPTCRPTRSDSGPCETVLQVKTNPDRVFVATFFRDAPAAIHFSQEFGMSVRCPGVGATVLFGYRTPPGVTPEIAGQRCEFRTGALSGLQVLIERLPIDGGAYIGRVHVFSQEYVERDRAFADVVAKGAALAVPHHR